MIRQLAKRRMCDGMQSCRAVDVSLDLSSTYAPPHPSQKVALDFIIFMAAGSGGSLRHGGWGGVRCRVRRLLVFCLEYL